MQVKKSHRSVVEDERRLLLTLDKHGNVTKVGRERACSS